MADHKIETCAFCGRQILPRESRVVCSSCNRLYHMVCWGETGRCRSCGCEGEPVYHPVGETESEEAPPPSSSPSPVPDNLQNYLAWAILATIFCCIPFGIVAIVYAAQVNVHLAAGNYEAALQASSTARNWCLAATITGLLRPLLYILFMGTFFMRLFPRYRFNAFLAVLLTIGN